MSSRTTDGIDFINLARELPETEFTPFDDRPVTIVLGRSDPLTPEADYDEIRETDRLSIVGLADLAPDRNVDVVVHHEDGSEHRFQVAHTLNEEQIGWFRAGSALNLLRAQSA